MEPKLNAVDHLGENMEKLHVPHGQSALSALGSRAGCHWRANLRKAVFRSLVQG